MKTRTLALLLILSMLILCFAGCGAKPAEPEAPAEPAVEEAAPESPAEEPPAAEEAPEPAEEAPEAPEAEEASEPAEAPEAPPADAIAPGADLSYPMDGSETITGWFSFFGGLTRQIPSADYNDLPIKPYLEEGAGVKLDIITISEMVVSEQFPLMVASGDWPDYCNSFGTLYSGGLLQGFEDECILEFSDEELAEKAPAYWAVRSQLTGDDLASALEGGMNLAVYTIFDEFINEMGLAIRGDWYEALGSPAADRLDTFTDLLYQLHDTFGPNTTFHVEEGGYQGSMDDAFGVYIPQYTASTVPTYVEDGVVKSNLVADGYYDYIQWFRGLYADGIINQEFYNRSMMTYDRFNELATDSIGVMSVSANSVQDQNYYRDPGTEYDMLPLNQITAEDGTNEWGTYMSRIQGGYTIASDSPHPDTVLAFFNYMYTYDGYMYGNYGMEGLTYDFDESGEPYFTDLIVNNEQGTMAENAIRGYNDEIYPVYRLGTRLWCTYNDVVMHAAETWAGMEYTTDYYYPVGAGLTTEEQSQITNTSADIMTYISTEILGFLTCAEELNEDTWNEYVSHVESMGLNDVLAVYQTAYDEYMAGQR